MSSIRFVFFGLCFLLLFACDSGENWQSWERRPPDLPPDFVYETAKTKIDNPVFSSIILNKRGDVIQALDKQSFIQIKHAQIAEYSCNDCGRDSGATLQNCKKSDYIYLVRHLSAEKPVGALYFFKIGTALYTVDYPRQFFTPKTIKNPYLICLDFELTDVYTEVVN